ncbi:sugar ABC transporter permease [Paenibacillus lycopersici]|uniref:Sugar ABC transporter permease n=1 Tax=Paenibacillus lycopersici TaxID=2704462 RepID=A0A6C0G248_9BACL|nr:ABC transporter permease subunit [Paenibacillus lycopersici]QHT63548.1 sugar ABC transporter permease [Paenibacillus lycopersici]
MHLKFIDRLKAQWQLQAMVWPGILLMIVFSFIPMFGLIIAFQDYSPLDGFMNSEFVGLDNFKAFLGDSDFYNVLTNTLGISVLKLLIGFPLEIVLAIMINELRTGLFKKFTQTVSYLPHFLSWVILGGMFITWLSSAGLVNSLLMALHLTDSPIPFLTNANGYWWVATLSDIWKEVGWGTILYLAAMAGIDPSLYEAARVDGAKKLKQIRYITLPGISHIIVLMFVLRVGSVLGSNLEQALVLQNGSNIHRSEVIDLYVYHLGLTQGDFSFATAVGIFSSVVSVILLLGANFLTKRVNDSSIF